MRGICAIQHLFESWTERGHFPLGAKRLYVGGETTLCCGEMIICWGRNDSMLGRNDYMLGAKRLYVGGEMIICWGRNNYMLTLANRHQARQCYELSGSIHGQPPIDKPLEVGPGELLIYY